MHASDGLYDAQADSFLRKMERHKRECAEGCDVNSIDINVPRGPRQAGEMWTGRDESRTPALSHVAGAKVEMCKRRHARDKGAELGQGGRLIDWGC
jgi:hypothetical protein